MLLHQRELHQAKPGSRAELGNVPAPGSKPSTNSQLPAASTLSAVRARPGQESLVDPSHVLHPPGWVMDLETENSPEAEQYRSGGQLQFSSCSWPQTQ